MTVWLCVDAPLAARHVLKVLYGVSDIDSLTRDASLGKRPVEHFARRADEWQTRDILLVARLLANKHELRVVGARTKHGLCRRFVQRAACASACFRAKLSDRIARNLNRRPSTLGEPICKQRSSV